MDETTIKLQNAVIYYTTIGSWYMADYFKKLLEEHVKVVLEKQLKDI